MNKIENITNNLNMNKKITKFIKEMIYVVIGSFLIAFSIAQFLLPNQLSTGGFSGIATIIYYISNKISIGTIIVILNVPLLLLASFKLGKRFLLKAIIGIGLLSVIVNILEGFDPWTKDKFLACVYGGIIDGIGIAFILKGSASTGGTDLLISIIRKYKPEMGSGSLLIMIDTIIVLSNVIFFKTVEIGLYSAIAIYLASKMVDIIFEGVNFSKVMLIISDKYEEISKEIQENIERGTTGLYGKGMYTNEEKTIILCVTSRNEVMEIRKIIKNIDEKAFVTIINAREVFGNGFKEENKIGK